MKRVPFVQQFYTTECGVCVITSILNYYKSYYSINDVRAILQPGRDGTSLRQLITALKHFNFKASAFKVNILDEKSNIILPAIITWEDRHYVILEKLTAKYVYITDSETGNIKIGYEEFNLKFSGIIIQLHPENGFVHVRRKKNVLSGILNPLIMKYKFKLLIIFILSILSYIVTILIPLKMQKLVDDISQGGLVYKDIFILIILVSLSSLVGFLKSYQSSVAGICIDREVNSEILNKVLNIPYIFFDRISNPVIFFALDNVASIKNVILNDLTSIIFESGLVLIILGYFATSNMAFFIIIIIMMIPSILILYFSNEPIIRENRQMMSELSTLKGYQVEVVNAILGIKASSLEEDIYRQWENKYERYYKKSKGYFTRYNAFASILITMVTLSPIITLIFSFLFSRNCSMTVGYVLAFYFLSDILFNSIFSVLASLHNLSSDLIYSGRVANVLALEDQEDTRGKDKIILKGNIIVNNLYFRYLPDGNDILKDISFCVNSGEKVAITGLSGSGKSTLMKVIAGIYSFNNGAVYFDSRNLETLDLNYVKKQIGFVSQNSCLLNKSIYDNIVSGIGNVVKEDVYEACRIANIHDEIMGLPMKYQTVVSEMGKNLSGGQCQRIIIARLVLLKPKIVFLDEATNALNKINERKILDYFYKIKCTIIMVTHRLDLLKDCNNIIVIKNGRVYGQGQFDELLKTNNHFNELLK